MLEQKEMIESLARTVSVNFETVGEELTELWNSLVEMEERGSIDVETLFNRIDDIVSIVKSSKRESELVIEHSSSLLSEQDKKGWDDGIPHILNRNPVDFDDDFVTGGGLVNPRTDTILNIPNNLRYGEFDTITKIDEDGNEVEVWATNDWESDWDDEDDLYGPDDFIV